MEAKKILYVTQEMFPYLPTSEMADISRKLPQAIQELGREIRTFMPKYGLINERRNQLHEVIRLSGMNIIIDDTDHQLIIKVASIQSARMQVYFIDNEDYFRRKNILVDAFGKEFEDNAERALFFARGVLETVKKLRWTPDIIHCHGWFTSLLPVYIKKIYKDDPFFSDTKVITSLYDKEFKLSMKGRLAEKIVYDGVPAADVERIKDDCNYVNLCKFAVDYSDGVIQGSQKVNSEVLSHAKKGKRPFLEYFDKDHYVEAYNAFYNKILGV